ncbi:cytochrome P450 9e2-like [Colletes latitarsis]|uniref:cytochrome P450 9e2-like n=1 Tax=Colletes latitarsis TaxID=2605962 RepID=UPI0040358376
MDLFTVTLLLGAVFLLIYYYLWRGMNYFKERGIAHDPVIPIIGHMLPVMLRRIYMGHHLNDMYNRYSDRKYFGFYNFIRPIIVIRDPDLVNSIAIKNFDYFTDHHPIVNKDLDPLVAKNLFGLKGDEWREMRKLLSPSFSSAKMKIMFKLIIDCADNFTNHVATESRNGKVYELKEILGRYTTDVIATSSFGIAVDSMKDPENDFNAFARRTLKISFAQVLKMFMGGTFPRVTKLLRLSVFGEQMRLYFKRVVAETVRARKEQGIYRPDMIQLMMESRDSNGRELTIDEMTSQAFVFFLAGYDTSSTFMCFVLYAIAAHPDVQARMREEVEEVARKTDGQPTYDAIKDMVYMDAVLNETNRLYPSALFLDRVCVKEFELPPATPDSKPVLMKPGESVWFLPLSFQTDPKYFSDPLKFKPERFLNNEVSQKVYVPFGLGPRVCIGNRFALMETKIMLYYLLLRCEIEPCAKTTLPITFSKKNITISVDNGFWLNFKARKNIVPSQPNGVGKA